MHYGPDTPSIGVLHSGFTGKVAWEPGPLHFNPKEETSSLLMPCLDRKKSVVTWNPKTYKVQLRPESTPALIAIEAQVGVLLVVA